MAVCKDIIITLVNFNPLDTYTVMIKRADNIINDGTIIPSYTQTATGGQTLFKSLPDGEYVAGVKRTCASGGQSDFVWKDVVGNNCIAPQALAAGGITAVGATITWTNEAAFSFNVYVDNGFAQAPTAAGTFTMTGLVAGNVYQVAVKKKCKVSEFSAPATVNFATTVASPTFAVRVIRKQCTGTSFDGYILRFSLTGGLAAVGEKYEISFTEFDGTTYLLKSYTVGASDTLASMIQKLAGELAGYNLIVGSDFASFDMLSKEQKTASGVVVNCQDINLLTGYTVAIV